jgi:hypothetical protein
MQAGSRWKNLPHAARIADTRPCSGAAKAINSLIFCHGTALANQDGGAASGSPFGAFAMLPAIGVSLALDTIRSLMSPQPASSQPAGSTGFELNDRSGAPSTSPATASGSGSTRISSNNLNALIDAQSFASGGLSSALDSGGSASNSSQGPSASVSGTASSTYNAVNQLAHSTAIPVGLSVSA